MNTNICKACLCVRGNELWSQKCADVKTRTQLSDKDSEQKRHDFIYMKFKNRQDAMLLRVTLLDEQTFKKQEMVTTEVWKSRGFQGRERVRMVGSQRWFWGIGKILFLDVGVICVLASSLFTKLCIYLLHTSWCKCSVS